MVQPLKKASRKPYLNIMHDWNKRCFLNIEVFTYMYFHVYCRHLEGWIQSYTVDLCSSPTYTNSGTMRSSLWMYRSMERASTWTVKRYTEFIAIMMEVIVARFPYTKILCVHFPGSQKFSPIVSLSLHQLRKRNL